MGRWLQRVGRRCKRSRPCQLIRRSSGPALKDADTDCGWGLLTGGHPQRVTGITQLDKVDAFDDPATGDIEAGNDAFGEHGRAVWATGSGGQRIGALLGG